MLRTFGDGTSPPTVEGNCSGRARESNYDLESPNEFDNSEDDGVGYPSPNDEEYLQHGYFAQPGRPVLETHAIDLREVSDDPAWTQTVAWMNRYADEVLDMHTLPDVEVKVGTKSSNVVVVSSSQEPLYVHLPRPANVFVDGVTIQSLRPDVFAALEDSGTQPALFNVTRLARGKSNESALIGASRNANLLGATVPTADQEIYPWRLLVERGANGGGIDVAATLAAAKSRTISSLADTLTVSERAELAFPLHIPEWQTSRLDLMAFNTNTRRFGRIFSIDPARPNFALVAPTAAENVGPVLATGAEPAFASTFDWVYPGLSREPVTVAPPTPQQLTWAAQNPDGRLVFMKQARQWVAVQPQFGLSDARPRTSGFVQGQWQGSPATNLWIPDAATSPVPMIVQAGWTRLLPQP